MSQPKKTAQCAYCGRVKPITRDHIPPRNLFPEPRPSDLITVPCCKECQAGWSKDDEYFRLIVTSSANVYGDPNARRVNETVLRSLTKPSKAGFARLVRDNLMDMEVRTEAGIYLGEIGGLSIDKARFDRVAERIVRGLFWHEKGRLVPPEYEVINRSSQGGFQPLLEKLKNVPFSETRVIGNGMFAYRYTATEEDPDSTVWLSLFYGKLPFAGFTVKPKELR